MELENRLSISGFEHGFRLGSVSSQPLWSSLGLCCLRPLARAWFLGDSVCPISG